MPNILSLTHTQAKDYFLESVNYINFELPSYFSFEDMLKNVSTYMGQKPSHNFFKKDEISGKTLVSPGSIDTVNHKILSNKDGEYAWRPLEIIHPVLYVGLVNEITSKESWESILLNYKFYGGSAVNSESIPYIPEDTNSHKANQIKNWWTNIEQASLRAGLKFNYVHDADINDCYGSIYTHSISWALHGKETMKGLKNRGDFIYLGNRIDSAIMHMKSGQTNGIRQGSVLMDFIAEIVLGYIDTMLTEKLDAVFNRKDYLITRYRDDYKIHTNDPIIGSSILKELSEVLAQMGMKLNTSKTKQSSDPILASVKQDKIDELMLPDKKVSASKRLLQIYTYLNKYPNSGSCVRLLDSYYRLIRDTKNLGDFNDPIAMISILTNLALKNPRSYPWCMAIISQLLDLCNAQEKQIIILDVSEKFSKSPNTGMLDIWLKRISYKIIPTLEFREMLSRLVSGTYVTNVIWKSEWLEDKLKKIVHETPIIKSSIKEKLKPKIELYEVELFNSVQY